MLGLFNITKSGPAPECGPILAMFVGPTDYDCGPLHLQEYPKACLLEMVIGGKCFRDLASLHDDKTRAVG